MRAWSGTAAECRAYNAPLKRLRCVEAAQLRWGAWAAQAAKEYELCGWIGFSERWESGKRFAEEVEGGLGREAFERFAVCREVMF